MIHHVNTTIPTADLLAAANDAGMTVSQFEAQAIAKAVEEWRRRKEQQLDAHGVIPGGD